MVKYLKVQILLLILQIFKQNYVNNINKIQNINFNMINRIYYKYKLLKIKKLGHYLIIKKNYVEILMIYHSKPNKNKYILLAKIYLLIILSMIKIPYIIDSIIKIIIIIINCNN